jgi:hypothetical protein
VHQVLPPLSPSPCCRCVGAYWDSGSRARATRHLVHAWVLWRQAVKAARQLRHKMAIAERWHARVALQRNMFAAWRRRCLANQHELAQKRADAQVAAARAELGAEKDAEIAAIRCVADLPAACGHKLTSFTSISMPLRPQQCAWVLHAGLGAASSVVL